MTRGVVGNNLHIIASVVSCLFGFFSFLYRKPDGNLTRDLKIKYRLTLCWARRVARAFFIAKKVSHAPFRVLQWAIPSSFEALLRSTIASSASPYAVSSAERIPKEPESVEACQKGYFSMLERHF